jgi:autophagy-related protein 16
MYVAFSANEELVLGAGSDNATRVWSIEQCRLRVCFLSILARRDHRSYVLSLLQHSLTGHTGKIYAAEFTSDSQRVVSGSHDRTLKLWDLSRGYCTRTIFCFSSCNDLALNSTSSVIASAHFDGSVRLWDARQGEVIRELNVHQKPITSCCMAPSGRAILTLSRDNTLKLTDIRTFETIQTFK